MKRHVFTYGSLMFAAVWTRVVAGTYEAVAASLVGYARFAVTDQDYPGMVAREDGRVEGILYLDVDAADLARLDHFEGDHYVRETVMVDCGDGVERSAQTYRYLLQDRLLARPWEPAAFAMDHFIATYCRDKLGS